MRTHHQNRRAASLGPARAARKPCARPGEHDRSSADGAPARTTRAGGTGRAFALLIVLMAIAILTLVLTSLQASAFRQAAAGREAAARVRAEWAARAGLESTLARFEYAVRAGDTGSAYAALDDMNTAALGTLEDASWEIVHTEGKVERSGPEDPHSKININLMSREDLLTIPDMTEDVADAILDWVDADDTPRELGAEEGSYSRLDSPYEPRNGPMRSLFELELVRGVDPRAVRGEDWNLNGRLDPNEDDGDATWPPDNADGVLDAGWSAFLTTESIEGGLAADGKERLNVRTATAQQIVARFGFLDSSQAQTVAAYMARNGSRLEDLINRSLSSLAPTANLPAAAVRNLEREQIDEILNGATLADASEPEAPGRLNINTCARATLDYLSTFTTPQGSAIADALILARDSRPNGFANMMDLLEVPAMTRARLAAYSRFLTVSSNSYVVTSRGRDERTGIEVEITATIDRTRLPAVISEKRVR